MSLLRLGFIWTIVVQTINALSLTASLLDYGSFARSLLENYERLREPIFGKIISVVSYLGISLDLVHLDFILFYLLLSCNAYLAMPLVLNRIDDAGRKLLGPHLDSIKQPWAVAKTFFGHFFSWLTFGYSDESKAKMRQAWIDHRTKEKQLLDQKRYAAYIRYYLFGIISLIIMVILAIPLWAIVLLFYLTACLFMIAITLAVIPLVPFIILVVFSFGFIWACLFTYPKGWTLQQIKDHSLPALKFMVLPWFIPLLTVLGGVFVIYTVDSLNERFF
jgi:hypothetical protein